MTYTGAVSPAINHCLDAISIKDLQNNVIKSYKFNYLFQHKLFLDEIKEGIGMNQISKYRFKYKDLDLDYGAFEADYWGYYRAKDYDANCSSLEFHQRDADILHCTKDVLQQIIYPTGGSAIFEFESNNYSYIGDDDSYYMDWSENNFDANPYNWTISDELDNFTLDDNNPPNNFSFQGHNIYPLFSENTLTSDKILIFTTSITEAEGPSSLWLSKINPANNSTTQILLNTSGCPGEFRLESGFKYSVDFHWMDSTVLSSASISFKEKPGTLLQ
ncbi:MAG: hypothetical protein M0D53_04265 [Flavobacterium sp. JAD_PAG50586_2]|nr:MAG: hypothetical protein M0D53_04265 [Flavobacterium sp. JAD_PAG50586_2]